MGTDSTPQVSEIHCTYLDFLKIFDKYAYCHIYVNLSLYFIHGLVQPEINGLIL